MTLFKCCISFQRKGTCNLNILFMFNIYRYNSSRRILLKIYFFLVSEVSMFQPAYNANSKLEELHWPVPVQYLLEILRKSQFSPGPIS